MTAMDDGTQRHIVIEQVSFTQEEDDVPPPPPELASRFASVQEWLIHMIGTEQPDSSVTTYQFDLFQSGSSYTVSLVGLIAFSSGTREVKRIHFQPSQMYYPLPESDYKGLSWQEANDKLTVQLKEFTRTGRFQNSFLAQARAITTGYNGAKIGPQ